jgi:outer membrane protein OmpA-like peptidoglycan-associated protein/Mg-chelatase subunit ChlD
MYKLNRLVLLLAISVFIFQSCVVYDAEKEAVLPDLPPPADYKPIFIQDIKNINQSNLDNPSLMISRVDVHDPDKIKLYTHFIDNGNTFLSGAATGEWLKRWCELTIITDGTSRKIDKFTVRESTAQDRLPLSIALVLDHSGSMGVERAIACQEAVEEFVRSKKSDDAVSIIKYDSKVIVESPLTSSQSVSLSNFQKSGLQGFGGMTAVSDAIMQGIDEVSRSDNSKQRVVIVFTDGFDNSSKIAYDSVVAKAMATNTIICAIDFGYGINEGFMKKYSDATNGIYHHVYKKEEFQLVFEDIYKRFEYFYVIEFEQPDFGEHKLNLKLCSPKGDIDNNILINNLPDVGFINLLNIYFDIDKSTIKKESDKAIKRVAAMMNVYPGMVIEVRGHTDSTNKTSDPDYNIKLSQSRADAVKQTLAKTGISERRILTRGFGEHMPVAENLSPEGRAKNRRTEFVIIQK